MAKGVFGVKKDRHTLCHLAHQRSKEPFDKMHKQGGFMKKVIRRRFFDLHKPPKRLDKYRPTLDQPSCSASNHHKGKEETI
jgi:hypothetical protein